jgi:hypothetical protein
MAKLEAVPVINGNAGVQFLNTCLGGTPRVAEFFAGIGLVRLGGS